MLVFVLALLFSSGLGAGGSAGEYGQLRPSGYENRESGYGSGGESGYGSGGESGGSRYIPGYNQQTTRGYVQTTQGYVQTTRGYVQTTQGYVQTTQGVQTTRVQPTTTTPAPTESFVPPPVCVPGAEQNNCSQTCTCASDGMSWQCLSTCPPMLPGPGCKLVPRKNPVYPNCCPTVECGNCQRMWEGCSNGDVCNSCNKDCKCRGGAWSCVSHCPPQLPGKNCYMLDNTGEWPDNCCPYEFCPCDSIKCSYGKECVVDVEKKNASCVDQCNENCGKIYKPVCGTNGKTYANECLLRVADCKNTNKKIKVDYEGECRTSPPPTESQVTECTEGQRKGDCDNTCNCDAGRWVCYHTCGDPLPPPPNCEWRPRQNRVYPEQCCPELICNSPPPPPPTAYYGATTTTQAPKYG